MRNQAASGVCNALALKGIVLAIIVNAAVASLAHAQPAGEVVEAQGQVDVKIQPSSNWQAAKVNDALANGDEIQTQEGKSTLLLSDESMLKLNRNTYMRMREVSQTAGWRRNSGFTNAASPTLKSIYRLFKGEAWLRNNNREVDIEVVTPTVTASLRGTELHIKVISPDLVNITVLEGAVSATNASGSIQAVAGELIIAALGQAPTKQTLLTPEDSVQWTVRVPNILQTQDWIYANATPSQRQTIDQFFNDLSTQNIAAAQQRLAALPPDSEALDSLSGVVQLSAGEHTAAAESFRKATIENSSNPVAWRGLALSSLLIGDKQSAKDASQWAISSTNNPSAVDWLLLSYIQRAGFDLTAAEASAMEALNRSPNDVLALSNLSLLQFANDRVSEARISIEQALQVAPKDSVALSMLGFIQLSERDQVGASQSFEMALASDPSNSEAYLGASLLAQRQGQKRQAQQLLAKAIALEPQRSLFLSYWAKSLHEERRFDKALTVLDSASRLDSQDPTPHYYRSIIERDLFRAGEAINSLERAIELNDRRAVYRSRLLLDQDMATRNINLASIYGALGMNILATQKAVQSTLNDYRNFSAHLFLSSTLSADGRSFPAGSEILVSGLMLPANANSLSTINDYSAFFEGPEFDSSVTLEAGSDNTLGATASLAGVVPDNDLSYGFLASYFETKGFAGDNGGDSSSFAGTIKWQANPKDSFRARLSFSDLQQLDGGVRMINPGTFSSDETVDSQDALFDIGYRRELSHKSDLLLNMIYRETEFDTANSVLSAGLSSDIFFFSETQELSQRDTLQLQGQYSLKLSSHQLSTGLIYLDGEQKTDFTQSTSVIDQDSFILELPANIQGEVDQLDALINQISDSQRDQQFMSLYIDDVWKINPQLTLHIGAYFEDFDNATTDQSKLNPRFGLVWQPNNRDTFRLTGFRYLLPQVQARLHPTHVGGVFITRNTEEGALVEEVNLVWERNWQGGIFSANLFDLERENRETVDVLLGETLERSSLKGAIFGVNQQIGKRFAFSAGLAFTEIRDDLSILQTERDETNAALSLSYVSPKRITANLTQTYRRINFFESARSDETIPLTDLNLSYTFANRKGSVGLSVSNVFDEKFAGVFDNFSLGIRNPAREYRASVNWNF